LTGGSGAVPPIISPLTAEGGALQMKIVSPIA